jgi:hypothetical protein
MYRVPSEFMKQKTTIVGPITIQHGIGLFTGYLLGQALGGSTPVAILCVALGLALTTVRVQGLTLYRFIPLAAGFLVRKLTDDVFEPEETRTVAPTGAYALFDSDGTPIVYQEANRG